MAAETIVYGGESRVYDAFINEATYYDQDTGLSYMEKINTNLNDNNQ